MKKTKFSLVFLAILLVLSVNSAFSQTKPESSPAKEEEVFDNKEVEHPAVFIGGDTEMMKWIYANIKYPKDARENGIQGRVIVDFIIEKDGSISDPQVLKGIDESLDAESIRVIKELPKFYPGYHNGVKVRCYHVMPISFKLEG
jgi:periplasmic protein TonB